jgi:hypothetical protein
MNYISTPRTLVEQQADDAFIQKLDDVFDNLEFVFHSEDSHFAPENLIGTPFAPKPIFTKNRKFNPFT